jgi:hypothetical protein
MAKISKFAISFPRIQVDFNVDEML